jgi:SAM-dependent methyltransferase
MPLANSFVRPEQAHIEEPRFPLHVFVCEHCFLVQVEEFASPDQIFSHYVYFSSYSETWLDHCEEYARNIVPRFSLLPSSRVVEIASNDGALLGILQKAGLNVLGIEPARNVAQVAIDKGIPTKVAFFGKQVAIEVRKSGSADLIIANNVMAHVPSLNDFIAGLVTLLAPQGTITIEFPHLARLIEGCQFDTIYHEHFSYFSLAAAEAALARHGLAVYDAEELPVHGGSLRLYVGHAHSRSIVSAELDRLRTAETNAGLSQIETYLRFQSIPPRIKQQLTAFLQNARQGKKHVVGYAAAAKGNTLLNYCEVTPKHLDYVVDRNPNKQGLQLPGTRIPVHSVDRIFDTKPDFIIVLAWNLKDEIMSSLADVRRWGAQFVIPLPTVEIV